MEQFLLEAFQHPGLRAHSEFFVELLVEMMVAHSGEEDEFLDVSVDFEVVVLYEVAEVDLRADQRHEELRHLCFCVVGHECDEEHGVPSLTYGGVLELPLSHLGHDSLYDVPYAALHRQGVVHAPFKVAVRGKEVHEGVCGPDGDLVEAEDQQRGLGVSCLDVQEASSGEEGHAAFPYCLLAVVLTGQAYVSLDDEDHYVVLQERVGDGLMPVQGDV